MATSCSAAVVAVVAVGVAAASRHTELPGTRTRQGAPIGAVHPTPHETAAASDRLPGSPQKVGKCLSLAERCRSQRSPVVGWLGGIGSERQGREMENGGRRRVTFGVQVPKVELQARNTFSFATAASPAAVDDPKNQEIRLRGRRCRRSAGNIQFSRLC